jgi:hypothetical protein
MGGSAAFWLNTSMNGGITVPVTLNRNSEVEFPQVATIGIPTTALETLAGDRQIHVVPNARRPAEAKSIRVPVDIVEEWGLQSFPASDPPANW